MTEGVCIEPGCGKPALFLHTDGNFDTFADSRWQKFGDEKGWNTHWTGRCEEHQDSTAFGFLGMVWRRHLEDVKKSLDHVLRRTA